MTSKDLKEIFRFFRNYRLSYSLHRIRLKDVHLGLSVGLLELSDDRSILRVYFRVEKDAIAWISFKL